MRESRGRILTPYSMKVERVQAPLLMRESHERAVRSRMVYWRRISQSGPRGAR
jgi:hypothetical protein